MRYYLEQQTRDGCSEVGGHRKKTKSEINDWVSQNIEACGLDWRVGYVMKFRNSETIYTWRKLKDHSTVSVG